MEYTIINGELYHHGVKGMKWGVRKVRGHAGPGRYLTKKRQLAGDKKDLEYLNKGGHLSIGLTKKRQAAYDKKDRARLESRIAKNERLLANKQAKKYVKNLEKTLKKDVAKDLDKPYSQQIAPGVYANWPSKRKFIEAEINRINRKLSD